MLKADIRNQYLGKRQLLSEEDTEALSRKIKDRFFDWLPKETFSIHIFLPIKAKNEIDTWPIINKCWEKDINTLVPVMDWSRSCITSWVLTPETKLQENIWGIPEPVSADYANNSVIDVVVLPLLAFDRKGYRTGYGKGFYDKFLASCDDVPIRVGLSFFGPVPEISDIHDKDIPLDFCITPESVFEF